MRGSPPRLDTSTKRLRSYAIGSTPARHAFTMTGRNNFAMERGAARKTSSRIPSAPRAFPHRALLQVLLGVGERGGHVNRQGRVLELRAWQL
eukprot:4443791-Pyramimonas_sp.AAC.1